jgi:DNA-binding NarL/FixJ family response regulator
MTRCAKKLRLLIADDHELVRHGIRAILCAYRGWRVVGEAVDGWDAVQKAQQLKPDLAILDISMPNMDGLEATRKIIEAAPSTRVLILTMHESGQMVRRVIEAGARGYVLKSDLVATLVKAVREVSVGNLALTPRVSEMMSSQASQVEPPPAGGLQPTVREIQIIQLLAQGKTSKESASILNLSSRTVECYRARVMRKLNVKSTAEVIRYAIRNKIVEA